MGYQPIFFEISHGLVAHATMQSIHFVTFRDNDFLHCEHCTATATF
jgi:hypothetical protein